MRDGVQGRQVRPFQEQLPGECGPVERPRVQDAHPPHLRTAFAAYAPRAPAACPGTVREPGTARTAPRRFGRVTVVTDMYDSSRSQSRRARTAGPSCGAAHPRRDSGQKVSAVPREQTAATPGARCPVPRTPRLTSRDPCPHDP
ncbi:hypothetical protein GCM10010327_65860 [Streptomyces nitrosporeus]|nr:hypothetical protein GCM10010327_65860 [Streptomyces nitrosporeus]